MDICFQIPIAQLTAASSSAPPKFRANSCATDCPPLLWIHVDSVYVPFGNPVTVCAILASYDTVSVRRHFHLPVWPPPKLVYGVAPPPRVVDVVQPAGCVIVTR